MGYTQCCKRSIQSFRRVAEQLSLNKGISWLLVGGLYILGQKVMTILSWVYRNVQREGTFVCRVSFEDNVAWVLLLTCDNDFQTDQLGASRKPVPSQPPLELWTMPANCRQWRRAWQKTWVSWCGRRGLTDLEALENLTTKATLHSFCSNGWLLTSTVELLIEYDWADKSHSFTFGISQSYHNPKQTEALPWEAVCLFGGEAGTGCWIQG